jgi:hypothetical protein
MAGVFDKLRESTVRSWYVPKTFILKEKVEKRWKEGAGHQARSGRPSMMSKHPEVETYVIDAITGIRAAGGTINSVVISSFFRGFIRFKAPALLQEHKLSRRWCRWWFIQKVITLLTYRTCAHLPHRSHSIDSVY